MATAKVHTMPDTAYLKYRCSHCRGEEILSYKERSTRKERDVQVSNAHRQMSPCCYEQHGNTGVSVISAFSGGEFGREGVIPRSAFR